MDIPARGITVLTGPSGSGKTTITEFVLVMHTTIAGVIRSDDRPLREIDLAHWPRRIGHVPQDLVLFYYTELTSITPAVLDIDDETVPQALGTVGA